MRKKSQKIKNILICLSELYKSYYGSQLKYLILYGSYARGTFRKGSDIDILVVLDKVFSIYQENNVLTQIKLDLMIENEIFISTLPVSMEKFEHSNEIFYKNVKREGIIL